MYLGKELLNHSETGTRLWRQTRTRQTRIETDADETDAGINVVAMRAQPSGSGTLSLPNTAMLLYRA
jgi:hypothetical protein